MKTIQQVLFGAIGLAATVHVSHAAISIYGTENFAWTQTGSFPSDSFSGGLAGSTWRVGGGGSSLAADWSVFVGTGTNATVADNDVSALNLVLGAVSHGDVITFNNAGAPNRANNGPSTGTAGGGVNDYLSGSDSPRYNTVNQNIQIAVGGDGSSFSFLQARARNTGASSIFGMHINFELAQHTPMASTDTIGSLALYYSSDTAGAAGTWNLVNTFTSTGQISIGTSQNFGGTIDLSSLNGGFGLPANGNIFFRWGKDNSSGVDRQFTIDNVFFWVPEPSTGLLAASAAAVLGFIRRRR